MTSSYHEFKYCKKHVSKLKRKNCASSLWGMLVTEVIELTRAWTIPSYSFINLAMNELIEVWQVSLR